MKLEQLLMDTGPAMPVTDNRRVCIIPDAVGIVCASGRWYMDQILKYSNREVFCYEVDLMDNKITITVKGDMIT